MENNSEIIIYQTEDGKTKINVRMQDETVWLSMDQLAGLFQRDKSTISRHIKNIFEYNELDRNSVVANFAITAADDKTYQVDYYNLDVIISVGYRVKSLRGVQFRRWATQTLKEYLVKGFAMNDDLLKAAGGGNYWKELLDRIRDIRSSEKVLYRQVLDLYATSVDYDPAAKESVQFFKIVQNKLHYAAHKHTAPEVIALRADAEKPFMGLTSFSDAKPSGKDIEIAKNYLDETELKKLNNLVSAYFDIAEIRAIEHIPMYMSDWVGQLDDLIKMMKFNTLDNSGTISHEEAVKKARTEYMKYQKKTLDELSPVEKDFFENIKKAQKKIQKAEKARIKDEEVRRNINHKGEEGARRRKTTEDTEKHGGEEMIPASQYCNKVFDGTHATPKPTVIGKRLVTSKHISEYHLDLENAYFISKSDYDEIQKRSAVSQWDILFSMIGTIGQIYLEQSTNIDYAIKNMGVFSCGDEMKAKYLYYYLKSPIAKRHIERQLAGAVQKFLSLGELRNFPVPEFAKNRIAPIKLLSALDDKIALNNKINKELEAMAKTLYDYWFVQFDFPNEKGKPFKSSGGKMVYNRELKREIPEGWEVGNLFDKTDIQYGYPFETRFFSETTTDNPIIRIRDILNNTISAYTIEKPDKKYLVKNNDLLIGMDGNFHMNFWGSDNAYLNQRSVRIRSLQKSTISNIQIYFEINPFIKSREQNISRTTVGHLSDKDLKRIIVMEPAITPLFNPRIIFDSILDQMMLNRKSSQTLASLRDFLLPMLMNGQVKINHKGEEGAQRKKDEEAIPSCAVVRLRG